MFLERLLKLALRTEEQTWIPVDKFLEFVRNAKTQDERLHKTSFPKKSNLQREIRNFGNDHLHENDQNNVKASMKAIYRFIFNHCNDLAVFEKLCNEICKVTSSFKQGKGEEEDETCFLLYERICESRFCNDLLCSVSSLPSESDLKTLHLSLKETFAEGNKWFNICWFEYHFQQSSYYCESHDLVKQTHEKWKFFDELIMIKNASSIWLKESKSYMTVLNERQRAGRVTQTIQLYAHNPHRPDIIEQDVRESIEELYPDTVSAIVIAHHLSSKESNSFDIFIELSALGLQLCSHDDIANLAKEKLLSSHSLYLRNTVFFKDGTFANYFEKETLTKRFQLRDDYIMGKFSSSTIASFSSKIDTSLNIDHGNKCLKCFPEATLTPLTIQNFDIFYEWVQEIPAVTQILLDAFINQETVKRMSDNENRRKYSKRKLEKLYGAFTILLNCHNRFHIGVLQEGLSKDLLLYHGNVSHVFNITNQTGVTASLKATGCMIDEAASDDRIYFSTYIKEHKLSYATMQGFKEQYITLKNCHLVVMLDNLVRLMFKTDPNPSESRTGQKCLLPITLQGLPKDSLEVSLWHSDDCDGLEKCSCKQSTQLRVEDIEGKLINLLPQEVSAWQQFEQLCLWSNNDIIFKHLHTSPWLSNYLEEAINGSFSSTQTEQEECLIKLSEESQAIDEEHQESLSTLLDRHCVSSHEESDEDAVPSELSELASELGISSIDDADDSSNSVNRLITGVADIQLEQSFPETCSESSDNPEKLLRSRADTLTTLHSFGIEKYVIDSLLTLHPPPAVGRDDDIEKLREILSDILIKLGIEEDRNLHDRILVGVDHKIGKNLIALLQRENKFKLFLPEFPPLHLRKSKINTLFSAYKDTGLFQVLMYMKDDDIREWSKLSDTSHIDAATRTVKRIAMGLQLAMVVVFIKSLPVEEAQAFADSLKNTKPVENCQFWHERYSSFITHASQVNATFSLHNEWLDHSLEIVAVSLAERIGGKQGYQLLLAAVKRSLAFSFLNGAGAYSPYTVDLLLEHYGAGIYYQNMKMSLFSTPIYNSQKNQGSDTKRELGHQPALKAFKASSKTETIRKRLSRMDEQLSLHSWLLDNVGKETSVIDCLGWNLTRTDLNFVYRVASIILRQNALQVHQEETPYNMYTNPRPTIISESLLDSKTVEVGKFLIWKYINKFQKIPLEDHEILSGENLNGPKQLVKRALKSKGTTLKRTCRGAGGQEKTVEELKQVQLEKKTKRNVEVAQCLSSDLNTCQALVTPSGQKRGKQKSIYVPQALQDLLKFAKEQQDTNNLIPAGGLISTIDNNMFTPSLKAAKAIFIEFAGVKFKGMKTSGQEYLDGIVNHLLKPLLYQLHQVKDVVVCEEKYSFTPDIFKQDTRARRQTTKTSIAHLKSADEIIGKGHWNPEAIRTTQFGKSLVSNYLAENIDKLNLQESEVTIIVDSELHKEGCTCEATVTCTCSEKFSVPIACSYGRGQVQGPSKVAGIKQRKGEAEMSICDWLLHYLPRVLPGQAVASVITSGDIDAVVIHLFILGKLWRDKDFEDRPLVYVLLQKPGKKWDVYCITGILNVLQKAFNDEIIGCKVAVALCIGGNDFIPGFSGISHSRVVSTYTRSEMFLRDMISITAEDKLFLDSKTFVDFVATLYAKSNQTDLTFEQIREHTIKKKRSKKLLAEQGALVNHPRTWMPPKTAIENLAKLVQFQILYLETAGFHDALLPPFHECPCLEVHNGNVNYNFGPDSHISTLDELVPQVTDKAAMDMTKTKVTTPKKRPKKRTLKYTPQKGGNRKKNLTSTPKKL